MSCIDYSNFVIHIRQQHRTQFRKLFIYQKCQLHALFEYTSLLDWYNSVDFRVCVQHRNCKWEWRWCGGGGDEWWKCKIWMGHTFHISNFPSVGVFLCLTFYLKNTDFVERSTRWWWCLHIHETFQFQWKRIDAVYNMLSNVVQYRLSTIAITFTYPKALHNDECIHDEAIFSYTLRIHFIELQFNLEYNFNCWLFPFIDYLLWKSSRTKNILFILFVSFPYLKVVDSIDISNEKEIRKIRW